MGVSKGLLVAAMTVVALSIAGCGSQAQVQATPPLSSPTPSQATVAQVPTPQATSARESLDIPAGLDADALSKKLAADFSSWGMAGATPDLDASWDGSSVESFTTKIANDHRETYAEAMFGPDYMANPDIAAFVDKQISFNAANLNAYLRTYDHNANPADREPFTTRTEVLSVVSSSKDGDTVSVVSKWRDINNGDKNTISKNNNDFPTVIDATVTFTAKTVGSVVYIQKIKFS